MNDIPKAIPTPPVRLIDQIRLDTSFGNEV